MEKKLTSQSPLIALLVFLIALAGAFLFVQPMWADASSLAAERDNLLEEKDALSEKLAELKQIQQKLEAVSEVSRRTSLAAIPEKVEQDKLILDLAEIADKNDMVLNGVNFSIPTSAIAGEVTRVGITANVTGNEQSLVGFLKDIETNSRKLKVNTITIQIGESDIGISRVNFNLNMEAYYQGLI